MKRQPPAMAPSAMAWLPLISMRCGPGRATDRKSTRLNSSHSQISYAVFCLKKKKDNNSFSIDLIKKIDIVYIINSLNSLVRRNIKTILHDLYQIGRPFQQSSLYRSLKYYSA